MTRSREQGGEERRRWWGVPVVLAFLLMAGSGALMVAEFLEAPSRAVLATSAIVFALALALVIAVAAATRHARDAVDTVPDELSSDDAALPWLTPVVRSVLDQIDEAVHVTDAGLIIRYVNPAFSRVSGHQPEDALGRNAVELMRSGAHDEQFYEELHATLGRGSVWSGCLRNRRANGELFEAEETISPIRDAAGRVASYVSVQRDLSETEELERRMAQAKAIESFGLLAGGLAHDLNNFLIAIRTNVSFVQACIDEGSAGDADSRDALRETLEAIDRAGALARKLLSMGRVHDRVPSPVDPNLIVEGLEATLQHAVGRGIVLSTAFVPGVPRIMMEAVALEQIVINLVLNARDALREGGTIVVESDALRRTVYAPAAPHAGDETGAGSDKLFYRLRVRDNGPGIPEDIRDKIFEPFFTTKEGEGGTGLGLAVVKELVESARGFVELQCPASGGTEIAIYLPALDMEDERTLLEAELQEDVETRRE